MIPAANRFTVTLDASVLFPNMKRDLLLRFYEADLYRAQWTEEIQQEWLRNALAKYPDNAAGLLRADRLMREHFESAWIDKADYAQFLDVITLPDPDDRHVVAAAIAGRADYIVTDNLKDFPQEELDRFGLEVGSADQFLAGTFDHYPAEAIGVLAEHRQGLRSAPGPADYVMVLRRGLLPQLAARAQDRLDAL